MSDENQAQVRKILSTVKDPLGRYILSRCHTCFGDKYLEEVKSYLSKKKRRVSPATEQEVLDNMDILGWLNLMYHKWYDAFDGALERVNRSYVDILRDARHNLSHEDNTNDFTDMDVIQVANTATHLLEAIGAEKEAAATEKLGRLIYSESEQKNDEESAPANNISQPPIDNPNGQRHQSETTAASVRVATKAKEKADNPKTIRPPTINAEGRNQDHSLKNRKPANRKEHSLMTLQQLIRQNQKAIIIAIIIIAILVLIVIALQKPIDECDPEILGQRYSGLNHVIETARCKGLPL